MEQELMFHQVNNHTGIGNETIEWTSLIITGYVIIIMATLLHIFGIMLIIIKSSEMCNQLILLMHLSFVSIILLAVTTLSVYKHSTSTRIIYKHWLIVLYYVMQIVYICNLVLLNIDRLLVTFYDIRYRLIVTRTKLYIAIATIWIIGAGYGIIVKFSSELNYTDSTKEKVSLAYGGFTVAFTFVTYIVMSVKAKCMASKLRANQSVSREESRRRMIPLLMVLFYFLFSMLPSIIEKQMYGEGEKSTHAQMIMIALIDMHCINHLLDPLSYIFLQRSIRKKLKKLCCMIAKGRYQTIRTRRRNKMSTSSDLSSNSLEEIGIDNKSSVGETQQNIK